MKLTQRRIEAIRPASKDAYLWDASIKGFGLRIRPSGTKTFIYSYRADGGRTARKLRYTIGRLGTITLAQARKQAQHLAGKVASGANPTAERSQKRLDKVRSAQTVAALADEFIERYARPNNKSWREYQRILQFNVNPKLGPIPIQELKRRDIVTLLDQVADNSGIAMADHVLAVVRKMCNWHAARDDDFRSPIVKGMARGRPREMARDRVLSDEEVRQIWNGLTATGYPFAPLVQLLFYTAQRRQEVAEARWEEVQHGVWTIPADRYKTKRANVVPLPAVAAQLLEGLPRNGPLVFSFTSTTPFSGFSKAKTRLDKLSGVSNWRLHDIRRTSRTLMVRAGVRPDVAERVLGHTIPGVAGVYDRYDYINEKQQALEALAREIEHVVRGNVRGVRLCQLPRRK